MTLLGAVEAHFLGAYPWARVMDHGADGTTQVVVVGDLKGMPVLVFTSATDGLVVEQVTSKGTLEQAFAFEGNRVELGVIAFVGLTDWSEHFASIRFPVKEFTKVGVGKESCEWEWMHDQKSKVFTHRIVLPKEESTEHSGKLERKGFKRMFDRVLKVIYKGHKKLRTDLECEWHKCWVEEGEEK